MAHWSSRNGCFAIYHLELVHDHVCLPGTGQLLAAAGVMCKYWGPVWERERRLRQAGSGNTALAAGTANIGRNVVKT